MGPKSEIASLTRARPSQQRELYKLYMKPYRTRQHRACRQRREAHPRKPLQDTGTAERFYVWVYKISKPEGQNPKALCSMVLRPKSLKL